jgi:hypothetical protein
MKLHTKEQDKKRIASKNKAEDIKEMQKQELIEKIQEETKELLIPTLKEKMEEATNFIVSTLKEKELNNVQIMSLIAKGSTLDAVLGGKIYYTPPELKIAFDLYLDMINKINEIKLFPPTIESFTAFIGISTNTYNSWLSDPERKDVMGFIHSYLLGVLATSSLTGETKEISSIYIQKTMGKVEQVAPVVVEHKKNVDITEIQNKLEELKHGHVVEAEWTGRNDENNGETL